MKKLKAFQSGIGDNQDLLPKPPLRKKLEETFDCSIRLHGTEIITINGYPRADFNASIKLEGKQNEIIYPAEDYEVELTAYPYLRASYQVHAKARANPVSCDYRLGINYIDNDPDDTEETERKADIMWVVDTSGSMSDDMDNVAQNIEQFTAHLADQGITARHGIRFMNPDRNHLSLTTDLAAFQNTLTNNDYSGGVEGERLFDGVIWSAENANWDPKATRFIIALTDEGEQEGDASYEEALASVNSNDIIVSSIVTIDLYSGYDNIAINTGGVLADISQSFSGALQDLTNLIITETSIWTNTFNEDVYNQTFEGDNNLLSETNIETMLINDPNIPNDIFTNTTRYEINEILIRTENPDINDIFFGSDVNTKVTGTNISAARSAFPYATTEVDTGIEFDITSDIAYYDTCVLYGTQTDGKIADLGLPLYYPPDPENPDAPPERVVPEDQIIDFTIINHTPNINIRFNNGSNTTTSEDDKILISTSLSCSKTISGTVSKDQPIYNELDLSSGWNPAIPNEDTLSDGLKVTVEYNVINKSETTSVKWARSNTKDTDQCTLNGYTLNDELVIENTHQTYAETDWTSNPQFFTGWVNGDGSNLLKDDYKALLNIYAPVSDTHGWTMDFHLDNQYQGHFSVPSNVILDTLIARLDIKDYEYDYSDNLSDQGVIILFDENRQNVFSLNSNQALEENIIAQSNTNIIMEQNRPWTSSPYTINNITIKQNETYKKEVPSTSQFNLNDNIIGPFSYTAESDNQNINLNIIKEESKKYIIGKISSSPAWPLKIHNGYYYLNQIEHYLYADKATKYVENIGLDNQNRYKFILRGEGNRKYTAPKKETIQIDSKSDFEKNKVVSNLNINSYPGKVQLGVNNNSSIQYVISQINSPINDLALDEVNNILWIATANRGVIAFNLDTKAIIKEYTTETRTKLISNNITSIAVFEQKIAVAFKDEGICVINTNNDYIIRKYNQNTTPSLHWHNGDSVVKIAFENDIIFSASNNGGGLTVINTIDNSLEHYRGEHYENYLTSMSYKNGVIAVGYNSGGAGSGVLVWNYGDNETVQRYSNQLRGDYKSVTDVEVANNKTYILQGLPRCIAIIDESNVSFIDIPIDTTPDTISVKEDYIYIGSKEGLIVIDETTKQIIQKETSIINSGLGSNINIMIPKQMNDEIILYVGTEEGPAIVGKKYHSYGKLVSEVINLSNSVISIDPIEFYGDIPEGTNIIVSARTSEDGENWSQWELTPPKNRYYQYQIEMTCDGSNDYKITPTLDSIYVTYYKSTNKTEDIVIDTDEISFIITPNSGLYQLFNETATEILWDFIKEETEYETDNITINSITPITLTENVEVIIHNNILYAKTEENLGETQVDYILNDVPQQGSPIIVTDTVNDIKLRRVNFKDEWDKMSLINQETLEVTKESTVLAAYKDLQNITAYDEQGNLLDVTGHNGNRIKLYRARRPLGYKEKVTINYILRDSFFADFNYSEDAVRFMFSANYDNLKIEYEKARLTPFYIADEVELNPLYSPYYRGFVYLTDKANTPYYTDLVVTPNFIYEDQNEKVYLYCIVKDKLGNPVRDVGVVFQSSDGIIESQNNRTNKNGIITAVLQPTSSGEAKIITSFPEDDLEDIEKTITIVEKTPEEFFIYPKAKTTMPIVGYETTITATVIDSNWNYMPNQNVSFEIIHGPGSVTSTDKTDSFGKASAKYISNTAGLTIVKMTTVIQNKTYEATIDIHNLSL